MDIDSFVQISRDPFARFDTIRRLVPKELRRSCTVCGREGRFHYGYWPDSFGAVPYFRDKPFCSITCFRSYY